MTKATCRECKDRKQVNCFLLLPAGSRATICKGCIEQARIDRAVEFGAPERNYDGMHDRAKVEGVLPPVEQFDRDQRFAYGYHLYDQFV